MIGNLNSAQFRQAWPHFSSTAKGLFRILYLTQDFVPSSHIEQELNVSPEFRGVRSRISVVLESVADLSSSYGYFEWKSSDGYRIADHLRPVVGELLGYHDEEKTNLLDTIWTIKKMLDSLTSHINNAPEHESVTSPHEFEQLNSELDNHLQSLLKPPAQQPTPEN